MRTVIKAAASYRGMVGFVVNILQRLIVKQAWKQPRVWEGFIKCCKSTAPQSYAVVLQLPTAQLTSFLESAPELRDPLLLHVENFSRSQRAHVQASTMAVLYSEDELAAAKRLQEMTDKDKDKDREDSRESPSASAEEEDAAPPGE